MMLTRVALRLVFCLVLVAPPCDTIVVPPARAAAASARDAHGGESAPAKPNPLEWKTDLAIWTGVVFLVLLAVLWKFAWGPIVEGLQKREQGIANQIDEAEKSNAEAKRLLEEYQQILANSEEEIRRMLESGRHEAQRAGQALLDQAKEEARSEKERGIREIEAATSGALKELAEQSATMAVHLAGKIVGSELKTKDHARLVEQAVAGFVGSKSNKNGS